MPFRVTTALPWPNKRKLDSPHLPRRLRDLIKAQYNIGTHNLRVFLSAFFVAPAPVIRKVALMYCPTGEGGGDLSPRARTARVGLHMENRRRLAIMLNCYTD